MIRCACHLKCLRGLIRFGSGSGARECAGCLLSREFGGQERPAQQNAMGADVNSAIGTPICGYTRKFKVTHACCCQVTITLDDSNTG
jgi:hypothetical protein